MCQCLLSPAILDTPDGLAKLSEKYQELLEWVADTEIDTLFDRVFFSFRRYGLPQEDAYTALLRECDRRRLPQRGINVLYRMLEADIQPSENTLRVLLHCLATTGKRNTLSF